MVDLSFPAQVTITREVDPYGLPVTRADLDVSDTVKALPLPSGPAGEQGPRGRPMPPFRKQGTIANAAARPTGLTPADDGKWWHRLDTDGMDVWTAELGWVHSPDCVGPVGPVGPANTLAVTETISDPALRNAAVVLTGDGAAQAAKVTAPAGLKGIKGPNGVSGPVRQAPDMDQTQGFAKHSAFGWQRNKRAFRAMPPPVIYGPWAKYSSDLPPDPAFANVDTIEVTTIDIPALPFAWRPRVTGRLQVWGSDHQPPGFPHLWARLGDWSGPAVAMGLCSFRVMWVDAILRPYYSETGGVATAAEYGKSVRMSPNSKVGIVAPEQPATIYFRVERAKGTNTGGASHISYQRAGAYLQVEAIPVRL